MIFLLDRKEIMVGVLDNSAPFSCPYFDDLHTENIVTGVNTYDFSVPANHETAGKIESNGYVIIRDLDEKLQMFQIKDIEEESNDSGYNKRVYCEHIAIPELLGDIVRPAILSSYTLENAINYVLQGTGWTLGEVDYTESKDIEFDDYMTVLEALFLILETFEVEVQYEVIFTGGKVVERLIHVTKQRGTKTYKRFEYGKDLSDVVRKENSEGIVTALIGVGSGDVEGTRLSLARFNKTPPKGYEKPVEADWIGNEEALQLYGKNGKHIFGVFIDDKAENQATLFDNTLKELMVRSKPKITYDMKVFTLERISGYESEKVRAGDTITADDDSFVPRLSLEARILELQRSYTNPENDAVTLGDYRPIKIAMNSNILKIQQLISANEEKWNALPYIITITSSGGTVFKNGGGTSILTAHIYKGDTMVDFDGTRFSYVWKKYDKDGNEVPFDKTGKTILISDTDVYEKATFSVEVFEY